MTVRRVQTTAHRNRLRREQQEQDDRIAATAQVPAVRAGGAGTGYATAAQGAKADSAVQSIVAGSNVTVNNTDPQNPIVSASGGGGGSGGYLDPSTHLIDPVYDFLVLPSSSGTPIVSVGSGGSASLIDAGAAAPGVVRLNSGTASTVRAITIGSSARLRTGAGVMRQRFRFRVPVLSNGSDRYTVNIGFRDVWPSAGGGRIDIRYTDDTAGGVFELASGDGIGTTFVAGTTVLVAGTWYNCMIEVAADGLSASLYVNGALEVTVNTTMPTALMYPGALILHRAGSASNLDLDYFAPTELEFTTPR